MDRSSVIDRLAEAKRRFIKNAGSKALWSFERTLEKYSTIADDALIDRDSFPWVTELEAMAPRMRRELDALLVHRALLPSFHEISPDQVSITRDDGWKTYFFYAFGKRSKANCARCPQTALTLARIPNLVTAFFSLLAPGKRVPPHRGAYKGVVRAHLGLKVASPEQCGMAIANTTVRWREGEVVLFDDTRTHEVWNESNEDRIVLLVDVLRPLRAPVRQINRILVAAIGRSPYVTDGERNQRLWEARFERAIAGTPDSAMQV